MLDDYIVWNIVTHKHKGMSSIKSNITYSECTSAVLGIQRVFGTRSIFICGLSGSTRFHHIIWEAAPFWGEKYLLNTKVAFFYFLYNLVWNIFSFWEKLTELW